MIRSFPVKREGDLPRLELPAVTLRLSLIRFRLPWHNNVQILPFQFTEQSEQNEVEDKEKNAFDEETRAREIKLHADDCHEG